MKTYKEKAKIWIWASETANWHFVYIDRTHADEIKEKYGRKAKGFKSIPVEVTLGKSVWETSIFPSKKDKTYILPLKAKIRRAEDLRDGEEVEFKIRILV